MIWEPYIPGSLGGEMQCPSCGHHTPESWKKLLVTPGAPPHRGGKTLLEVPGPFDTVTPREEHRPLAAVVFDWMHCANPKCGDLVVRMHETRDPATFIDEKTGERTYGGLEAVTATSQVRPRFKSRPLPDEVTDPWRKDYLEAAAILVASPRMSAVLSRRILGDLLEQYADLTQFRLEDRVDAFIADVNRPREIRENLHYFREIANFGAHTQKDDQQEIIDVTEQEAEWTLDVLDSLFEHFIVAPARDESIRESIAAKIEKAGRDPITPLPPDPEVSS
jgi:hypothetical protein